MDIRGREKNWCLCCYFLGLRRREDACRAAACCAALVFGKESCRQIDEHQLLLDSMEGGTGGPAAWVLLIYYVHPEPLYFFNNVLSS